MMMMMMSGAAAVAYSVKSEQFRGCELYVHVWGPFQWLCVPGIVKIWGDRAAVLCEKWQVCDRQDSERVVSVNAVILSCVSSVCGVGYDPTSYRLCTRPCRLTHIEHHPGNPPGHPLELSSTWYL